jgi:hypothetical protein
MPYTIDTNQEVMRIRLSGSFTHGDLMSLAKEAERSERSYGAAPHRITDAQPCTRLELTFRDVLQFVQERLRLEFPNPFKSALVAQDLVHYGFARMYETLNDHPQIVIAIFSDEAEALKWIAEPGLEPYRGRWTPPAKPA